MDCRNGLIWVLGLQDLVRVAELVMVVMVKGTAWVLMVWNGRRLQFGIEMNWASSSGL
jgi:hypothetical protein